MRSDAVQKSSATMESPAEEGGGPTASPDEPASPAGTKEAVAAQGDPTELASSAKKIEHEQAVQAEKDKHEAIEKHGKLEREHKERSHTVWWKLDDIDMEVGCCLPLILLTMSS